MSPDTAHENADARLDAWLRHGLDQLTDSINGILDLDAGVRDAQLPAQAQSLDDALASVLDVDAGLRAILPARTPVTAPDNHENTATTSSTGTDLSRYGQRLARLPVSERLALRSRLPLTELRLLEALARASASVPDLTRALDRADDRALTTLALILAHDLDRARAHARDLDHACALAYGLAEDADALSRAHADTRSLGDDLALVADLAHAHARDRANAIAAHALVRARAGALALARALDHSRAAALALARDRARDLALVTALTDSNITDPVEGLMLVLAAVTDFTTADLADLDLRRVDLQGVQWSTATTRWPSEWKDIIQETSIQLDPERRPDLYEIRDVPRIPHSPAVR
jgi:hypothetical protein